MVRSLGIVLALGLLTTAMPARAAVLTLPIIGDIENPDLDPFHILTPAPAPAPAAEAAKPAKKHGHGHHKKKKKA